MLVWEEDLPIIAEICEVLGSETRLRILKYLQRPPYIHSLPTLTSFSVPQLFKDMRRSAAVDI